MSLDPVASALGMSEELVQQAIDEQEAHERGKPLKMAKILQAMQPSAEDMANPFFKTIKFDDKPKQQKKALSPTERGWTEKDFAAAFWHYAIQNGTTSSAFEFKVSPTDSLPFSAVKEHQRANLLKAKHGKFYHKISDAGNAYGGTQVLLPFDAFLLVGVRAFIPIMYRVKERGNKDFALVEIDAFLEEEKRSDRKSLTESRAYEIGRKCTL